MQRRRRRLRRGAGGRRRGAGEARRRRGGGVGREATGSWRRAARTYPPRPCLPAAAAALRRRRGGTAPLVGLLPVPNHARSFLPATWLRWRRNRLRRRRWPGAPLAVSWPVPVRHIRTCISGRLHFPRLETVSLSGLFSPLSRRSPATEMVRGQPCGLPSLRGPARAPASVPIARDKGR